MYSCDAVQIKSSEGGVRANTYYDNLDLGYYLKPASFSNLKAIGTGGYVQYGTSVGGPSENFGNGRVYLYVHPTGSGSRIMSFKINISSTWNYQPSFGYISADVSFYFDGTSLYSAITTITSATNMARTGLGIGQPVLADGYVAIPIYSVNTNAIYAKLEGSPSFDYNAISWGSWVSVAYPGAAIVSVPGDIAVGGTITGTEIYNNSWFRNYNVNTGLYNQTTTMHLSSQANGYWDISSTTSSTRIAFYTGGHLIALRGSVYANDTSEIGLLNAAGSWGLRMDSSLNVYVGNNMTAVRSYAAIAPTVASTNWVTSFQNTPVSTMAFGGDISAGGPTGTWWFQVNMRHSNASNYWGTQLAYGWEDNANEIYQRNVTGGSFSGWVRYLNSNNYTSYAVPIGGATLDNIFYYRTNLGPYLGTLNSARLQVYNTDGGSAFMSFHKSGLYAVNFGLDADNVMRIGGWSASANRWQLDMSGNQTVAGTSTATGFFEGSDKRFKQLIQDDYRAVGVQNIKPKLYIKDGKEEVGYFAQDFQSILASAVSESKEGFLNLSYTQVHTAKIAIIEDEVDILKRRVTELESKLQKYEA
jgi:hypothetical protein